ncbi:energy transducer TonB [Hymenobacter sp. BT175]|uniref:energy transducer TonB n=1 Tax=Hymenobacter translucens TaxID=2886507 RepID=UPI001D0F341B|nr:energy transducer TonB [Hymenobacter translucens]MCC2545550.1 energy transducer TonB [Hymenobacter translucens]
MKKLVLSLLLLLLLLPLGVRAQKLRKTNWESGMMEKGKKVGEWEYYAYTRDGRQVVVQRYDHTTQKLTYFRPVDDIMYSVQQGPDKWVRSRVEQPPLFIGGDAALAVFTSKLTYPQNAQDRKIQGKVIVEFTVDTLGRASNHKVLMGIGGGCDEEALRTSKEIPNQWIPARKDGHAVAVVYEMPFTFRLRQE